MGIRYDAYAFDAAQTEQALADPRSVTGADPLADAWGLPPGFVSGVTDFEQSLPASELLYLDKAWSLLQQMTAPPAGGASRPAHWMFEGAVTVTKTELGWLPWVRALAPLEVLLVAHDLEEIAVAAAASQLRSDGGDREWATQSMARASAFVRQLADDGRGLAYLIG